MNILGINPVHNGSIALISNNELVYYLEEERLSRLKRDSNPIRAIHEICQKYPINEVAISGTNNKDENYLLPWTKETIIGSIVRKYFPKVTIRYTKTTHHLSHAFCAFINSGFDNSIVLVVDGAGSKSKIKDITCWEGESIFEFDLQKGYKEIYKRYITKKPYRYSSSNVIVDNAPGIGKVYEGVSSYLGFHPLDGGKTMGLSPYGKPNSSIPPLFQNGKGNRNLFLHSPPAISLIDIDNYPFFKTSQHTTTLELDNYNNATVNWHNDSTKIEQIEKDFAWAVQEETQNELANLIEKSVNSTGLNKICITGGYGLNCVTNYFLQKKFPNLKIYCEPISHDGGTAIGAAYMRWQELNPNSKLGKLKSLYLGLQYTKEQYLTAINEYSRS